jgi:Methyltransferase FkbM domain
MTDTIAVDTTFGRIETFVDDLITNQLLQFGAHTRPELALLLSIIEPGDFVFDVGAHIGTFSAPVARRVGPTGKVGDGGTSSTKTLDELAGQTVFPRVVKLDIEGLECAALRGATEILRYFPVLYIEINNDALIRYGDSVEELDTFLSTLGYNVFRNRGERNAAHDNYIVRKVDRLVDGGHFYDALAIHVSDPRIKDKINASRKLTMTEYQALFATDICDLPTHQYLRNPLGGITPQRVGSQDQNLIRRK